MDSVQQQTEKRLRDLRAEAARAAREHPANDELRSRAVRLAWRVILAGVVVGAVGCVELDREEAPVMQPLNERISDPAGAQAFVDLAQLEWSERLGAPELLDREVAPVIWLRLDERGCVAYPDAPDDCFAGRYMNDAEIHVGIDEGIPVGATALAHEMLHWSLRFARGDSNGAHDAPEWQEPLQAVQSAMMEFGP